MEWILYNYYLLFSAKLKNLKTKKLYLDNTLLNVHTNYILLCHILNQEASGAFPVHPKRSWLA